MTQETQVRGCHLCHIMNSSMTSSYPSTPLEKFDHQDKVFAQAFTILQQAIDQQAFPAASVAVTHQGNLVALKAVGTFTYEEQPGAPSSRVLCEGDLTVHENRALSLPKGGDFPVTPSTLFDLASLTKVVATTTMAMLLYERGLLDLEAPAAAIVPEFTTDREKDPRRHEVTLHMLLAHSSGLPAHEKFYLKARTRQRTPASRLHHAASRESWYSSGLQRYRIHNPRHRPRTSSRRIPRPLLPTRNLRPTIHDPHNLQSPLRNPRPNPPNGGRATRKQRRTVWVGHSLRQAQGRLCPTTAASIPAPKRKPASLAQHLPPKSNPRRSPR